MNTYIIRGKIIITLAVCFLIFALILEIATDSKNVNFNDLVFEYINVEDIATSSIEIKNNSNNILNNLFTDNNSVLTEVPFSPIKEIKEEKVLTNNDIWHLPTRIGQITQYPSYYHNALDLTSYRGTMEYVYPVAAGVISGIYTDSAGALIVTIAHNINGVNYTSQYVHLSAYADNIYVGKEVSINDAIGRMGQTGNATGIHLHLAVVDCKLFDVNDYNCRDLNSFFNYSRRRYNEGFRGLGSLINIPYSW